ncbi:hypothetical protein GMAR_ORF48 [Golden Marseillevirus]|uniref:hypothetical protein n=1 Tax=Golden Marseillevirus TaxID=1720526 RepID=UPI000877AA15|nr:hypothetical protein GMAR_ORF48 [Golden Marseillevirus]ALX27423.1 hypothetical protein GMAR_ORF48 [Golden Marseillevirus]
MQKVETVANTKQYLSFCGHIKSCVGSQYLSQISGRLQHSDKADVWLLVTSSHKRHNVFVFSKLCQQRSLLSEAELCVFRHILVDDSFHTNIDPFPRSGKTHTKASRSDLFSKLNVSKVQNIPRRVHRQKTACFDISQSLFLENSLGILNAFEVPATTHPIHLDLSRFCRLAKTLEFFCCFSKKYGRISVLGQDTTACDAGTTFSWPIYL